MQNLTEKTANITVEYFPDWQGGGVHADQQNRSYESQAGQEVKAGAGARLEDYVQDNQKQRRGGTALGPDGRGDYNPSARQ